jgi:hypothetical protein
MSNLTPVGLRLSASLDDEYLRMQNEWFFKWHFIGEGHLTEIDSFRGKPIRYGGIKFSGTAHNVYWDTIQYYLKQKIGATFDDLEKEVVRYSVDVRDKALTEAGWLVVQFAQKIRNAAVEKDRILRGNGIEFPLRHDFGRWQECGRGDIEARADRLQQIYCSLSLNIGGTEMPFGAIPKEKLTLVRKDGTTLGDDIPAVVSKGMIITSVTKFPIEVGDHFLRPLPNGLVEDYLVDDPGYHSGLGPIPPTYQAKVHRSDAPVAPPQTIIANFHGANSRMNVNSTDNSSNVIVYQVQDLAKLADEFLRLREALLPQAQSAEHYAAIGALASAELDAKSGEQPKVSALGTAGRWVLDTATKIGVPLATSLLKVHYGLPP